MSRPCSIGVSAAIRHFVEKGVDFQAETGLFSKHASSTMTQGRCVVTFSLATGNAQASLGQWAGQITSGAELHFGAFVMASILQRRISVKTFPVPKNYHKPYWFTEFFAAMPLVCVLRFTALQTLNRKFFCRIFSCHKHGLPRGC